MFNSVCSREICHDPKSTGYSKLCLCQYALLLPSTIWLPWVSFYPLPMFSLVKIDDRPAQVAFCIGGGTDSWTGSLSQCDRPDWFCWCLWAAQWLALVEASRYLMVFNLLTFKFFGSDFLWSCLIQLRLICLRSPLLNSKRSIQFCRGLSHFYQGCWSLNPRYRCFLETIACKQLVNWLMDY